MAMRLRHPRIVPWRTPEELFILRANFYPNWESGGPDPRPAALNQVQAYQVRGRVPHAIDSTAQLTTAVLLDIPLASTLHVRLAYSTAICRFVNGLLDPAQQSRFALPMHILARSLNLPAPFVEARHAATHETLPSLALLRSLALRALEWLRENYWAAVGTGVRELVGDMVLLGRARAAVKAWRKFRRANPVRELNTGDSSVESREARAIILECAGVCTEYIEEDGLQAVVTALLEEKALIPSGAEKIKMMKGAKLLWVPFLAAMEKESGGFVEAVVGGIVEILCTAVEFPKTLLRVAKATRNVQLDHRHQENEVDEEYEYDTLEVMLKWVEYIYSPKQRVPGGLGMGLSVEGLIKQLLLRPNEWSLRLYGDIIAGYPKLKEKYSQIGQIAGYNTLACQSPDKTKLPRCGVKRPLEDIETEIDGFEERFVQMRKRLASVDDVAPKEGTEYAGRWRRQSEKSWTSKPLGFV